ncbi:MAG: heavy metal translocating P-type ATPase [Fluviibacter sp.]
MSETSHHEPCYHCGLPIPDGIKLDVQINDQPRAMCCEGCRAVAEAIVANGLEAYYLNRDAMPESPREARPEILDSLALYDQAEFQKTFVRELGEGEQEASLVLEGITCAACVWLNEQHVAQLPGVLAVEVNYTTRRARIRWDDRRVKLSQILKAIADIGYRAHPFDPARQEAVAQKERRAMLWRLAVSGLGMMQVMMYAYPTYIANDGDLAPDIEALLRWSSLLLTLPVIFYACGPFFRNAWRDIKFRRVGMDTPVALGIGAAFVASVWATIINHGHVYYDSINMFVFFLLGGRYLELLARQKALRATEELGRLAPAFADRLLVGDSNEATERVRVSALIVWDLVLVKPGTQVPADGSVVTGQTSVDESLLTGESLPVAKSVGALVTGGSMNIESPITVRVEQIGDDTRLSAILKLMERGALEKPVAVTTADRAASWFLWGLLLLAAITAGVWWWIDPSRALPVTVAVLVVSCPCALSLATPVALTIATGRLAREGLLVTRGHAVETLAQVTDVVFDKTGTLTTGVMNLERVEALSELDDRLCLQLAASLEQSATHPLALALVRAANDLPRLAIVNESHETGGGIEATIEGRVLRIGHAAYVAKLVGDAAVLPKEDESSEATTLYLGESGVWLARFYISDSIRSDALAAINALKALGCTVSLLSGDDPVVAQSIAKQLGIENAAGRESPQTKLARVAALQAAGRVVCMVGDGVNDAPVLAHAQVSVAMGEGTELARTQADCVLLGQHLLVLPAALRLSRSARRTIRENLWWAIVYNAIALPVAMCGFLTPWLAGIGMSFSSLWVVLNSLRLQRVRIRD